MNVKQSLRRLIAKPKVWATLPKIRAYEQIEGFLSPWEAVTLYHLAARLPPTSTIVEIGTWKGKSTFCLARGLASGKVLTIDPFDASGETGSAEVYAGQRGALPLRVQFEERMSALEVMDKIQVQQGYSRDFVGKISPIHLLFIDGDHSIAGCDFDFTNFSGALAPGGLLALHDYDAARADLGPTWVVQNRLQGHAEFQKVGLYDSLWVAAKRATPHPQPLP